MQERSDQELSRAEAATLLDETQTALVRFAQAIDRFNEITWHAKPVDGGWSAAEVAEHVLLANDRLFAAAVSRQTAEVNPNWKEGVAEKEAWIRTVLPSQGKAKASAALSTFAGLSQDEVKAGLSDFAGRFDRFLAQSSASPLHAITWNHPILGELSAYLWLLYIPFHTERHAGQLLRLSLP